MVNLFPYIQPVCVSLGQLDKSLLCASSNPKLCCSSYLIGYALFVVLRGVCVYVCVCVCVCVRERERESFRSGMTAGLVIKLVTDAECWPGPQKYLAYFEILRLEVHFI